MTTEHMSDEYEAPELNEVGLLRKVTQQHYLSSGNDGLFLAGSGSDSGYQGNNGHHGS